MKKFVCNKEKLEGSICEGYPMQKAIGFCTKYIKDFSNVNQRVWDDDKDERVVGKLLEGYGHHLKLSIEERDVIHAYVIQNTSSFD